MADLAQLPLLDRSHLVTGAERFLVYPGRLMWQAQSSGTTGAPVTCYRTPGSSVFELSILERQWSWFGLSRSPRRVILRGSDFAAGQGGPPTKLLPGAHQLLVWSFGLTPGDAAEPSSTPSATSVPTPSKDGRRPSRCWRRCCTTRG